MLDVGGWWDSASDMAKNLVHVAWTYIFMLEVESLFCWPVSKYCSTELSTCCMDIYIHARRGRKVG